ncbi:hypothetical protein EJ08DRAFT_459694 [Tothia fuscella]|uniref:Uncharacterized protein n=1 Tax=Tothia fuscella TaxID=1048955 RepID=A0A9P4TUX7_9PEZI|nr:hypothetical protein EJ08DRAFT_459694 [Tothia fuscella]
MTTQSKLQSCAYYPMEPQYSICNGVSAPSSFGANLPNRSVMNSTPLSSSLSPPASQKSSTEEELHAAQAKIALLEGRLERLENVFAGIGATSNFANLNSGRRPLECNLKNASLRYEKSDTKTTDRSLQHCSTLGLLKPKQKSGSLPMNRTRDVLADRVVAVRTPGCATAYTTVFETVYGISLDSIDGCVGTAEMIHLLHMRVTLNFDKQVVDEAGNSTNRNALVSIIDQVISNLSDLECKLDTGSRRDRRLERLLFRICSIDLSPPVDKTAVERQIAKIMASEEFKSLS